MARDAAQSRRLQLTVGDALGGDGSPSPWGDSVAFENEFFEGRVFFVHEPPKDSGVAFQYGPLLAGRGETPPTWEVQIQGRFKQKPTGSVFLSLELRDGPMKLGLVTRALCKVILKVVCALARQRGLDFRHSFGNSTGDKPLMAFPLMGADRIFVHDGPVSLPIQGDDRRGVFKVNSAGAVEAELDRSAATPRTDCFMTFLFATPRVTLTTWTVDGIPGLGTLDLEQFWGNQALHMAVCDEPQSLQRRVYFQMRIHAPLVSAEEARLANEAAASPVEKKPPSRVLCGLQPTPQMAEAALERRRSREGLSPAAGGAGPLRSASVQEQTIAEEATEVEPEGEVATVEAALPRPAVGSAVLVLATGRRGRVTVDDGTEELPLKVEFSDGVAPFADWFSIAAVAQAPPNGISEEAAQAAPAAAAVPPPLASGGSSPAAEGDVSETGSMAEAGEAVEQHLRRMESALDDDRPDGGSEASDEDAVAAAMSISLPWYFRSVGGSLWWCVEHRGRCTWRPQATLRELCARLGDGGTAAFDARQQTFDDLERLRRRAAAHLADARRAPGLLDDFLSPDVSLASMIGRVTLAHNLEPVGVVDAEGCIAERLAWFEPGEGAVVWEEPDASGRPVTVRLQAAEAELSRIAGAPCVLLRTPTARQFALVAATEAAAERWATELQSGAAVGPRPSLTSLGGAEATAGRPRLRFWRPRSSLAFPEPPIRRWPDDRTVLNAGDLWLQPPAEDALQLSAALLRQALAAQSGGQKAVCALSYDSAALKCVDLSRLDEQRVWCFWVNVFHCLLLHGRLALGIPSGIPQVVAFFNRTSYVVAGHVFSLTELEHCLLRARTSRPRLKFKWVFLRVWARSDGELEERPCLAAPPCAAAQFRCRPDWRLNLVLSAGNASSSDVVPVFDAASPAELDELIDRAAAHTLAAAAGPGEFPYSLYRYRDDAPPGAAGESFESRWSRAIASLSEGGRSPANGVASTRKRGFPRSYDWRMRPSLGSL